MEQPLHRLVTSLLELAISTNATHIAIGYRDHPDNEQGQQPSPDTAHDDLIKQAFAKNTSALSSLR